MNNLNFKRRYTEYHQPKESANKLSRNSATAASLSDPVGKLADEVFQMILSHLDDRSLRNASLVSRRWSEVAVEVARHDNFQATKNLVRFLCERLLNQREALTRVVEDSKILASTHLTQVKLFTLESKGELLNILKSLEAVNLPQLRDTYTSKTKNIFLENIFDLAIIYNKIETAHQYPETTKAGILLAISSELVTKGILNKALEVTDQIPSEAMKALALRDIFRELMKKGDINKAIEVADRITSEAMKTTALQDICKNLMHRGAVNKAIETAHQISPAEKKAWALHEISTHLMALSSFHRAREVAQQIPLENLKTWTLERCEQAKRHHPSIQPR